MVHVEEYDGGEPSSLNKNNCDPLTEVSMRKSREQPEKETPLIETQKEEIVMSIPNLRQESGFPLILYCKVHRSYEIVK